MNDHLNKHLIPGWARWIAMDENGSWWCYEAEPHQHDRGWYENEVGTSQQIDRPAVKPPDWRESLQKL